MRSTVFTTILVLLTTACSGGKSAFEESLPQSQLKPMAHSVSQCPNLVTFKDAQDQLNTLYVQPSTNTLLMGRSGEEDLVINGEPQVLSDGKNKVYYVGACRDGGIKIKMIDANKHWVTTILERTAAGYRLSTMGDIVPFKRKNLTETDITTLPVPKNSSVSPDSKI